MERPILFNTAMVRAILDGTKTQTRRLVKTTDGTPLHLHSDVAAQRVISHGDSCNVKKAPCDPGDVLWVRETWVFDSGDEDYGTGCFMYKADMPIHIDAKDTAHGDDVDITAEDYKWHPSIHMPKEAARIFLRVKDVRAERLQDITEDDVCAEGAEPLIVCDHEHPLIGPDGEYYDMCYNGAHACSNCPIDRSYGEMFGEKVWNPTIKKADLPVYGWEANPWVWVIEFERCELPKEG